MRILITGGAGFIGSHIADQLLEAGHTPVVVDDFSTGQRSNLPTAVEIHEIDVCNRNSLEKVFAAVTPDAVCHQAAQMSVGLSVQKPTFDARVNILGLLNTLELAAEAGVQRFVFASSGGVLYGDVTAPADEQTPPQPISPYGISKWAGERYLRFFSQQFALETVALRYSNVYGPRQNPHGEAGVVAIFCQRMLRGAATTINGDGKYVRDYVYVADVARANVMALTNPLPEKFLPLNVGTAIGCDVNQLAAELRRLAGTILQQSDSTISVPAPEHGPARAGDLRSNLVDPSAIGRLWGWQPQVALSQGLSQTVAWFAAQK